MVLAASFHGFSVPGMLDSIGPTLDCNFTGTTCYWANDPNNWPVNWKILQVVSNDVPKETAVCLDLKSVFPNHGDMDVSGRLFGPLVNSVNSPQCLQLHYHPVSYLPSEDRLTSSVVKLTGRRPSLALLRRQMGPLTPIGRRARVLAHQEQTSSLTGRLWSRSAVLTDLVGDVHSSSVAHCIRFVYRLQLTSGSYSLGTLQDRTDFVFPQLSLLRHSSGGLSNPVIVCSRKLSLHSSCFLAKIGTTLPFVTALVSNPRVSSDKCLRQLIRRGLSYGFAFGFEGVQMSVHQGFPFLPLAESSSAPLHVCSFATDMCGWMNDPNSWRHKWRIVTDKSASIADQALCLSPLSVAESWIAGAGQRLPWSRRPMSTSREFSTSDESIQARLWSPPVLRDDALRCLSFQYRITGIDVKSVVHGPSLGLLRRQDGIVSNSVHQPPPVLSHWHYYKDKKGEYLLCFRFVSNESDIHLNGGEALKLLYNQLESCFGHSHRSVSRDSNDAYGHKLDRAPYRPSVLDCNFTALTSTCNWANDHNNWPANWQVVTNAVGLFNAACLDVRASPEAFSQSKELTARMFGPLVKSGIQLRCLRFYYMFQVPTLCATLDSDLFNSRHPDVLRLLDCNFEDPDEEFCFWQGDPRNQGAKWKRDMVGSDQVACLKPFSLSSRYTSVRSRSLSSGSLNGRLWSENVVSLSLSTVDQKPDTLPKCLRFQYLVDLKPANQLALLETLQLTHRQNTATTYLLATSNQLTRNGRQRSRLRLVDPVNCTYDSGDFCGWNDDPRDVLAWWEVVPMPTGHTQIACLVASTELGTQTADLLVKREGSARLWSGQIRGKGSGDNFLQCIRFVYQISGVPLPGARLSLMRHSAG
ncbi:hypothetical protein AHF37_01655 [Paragonimus kellicotti]|nr:hypothetical protein AHF37_01655 [Paragonimus kellicotti]